MTESGARLPVGGTRDGATGNRALQHEIQGCRLPSMSIRIYGLRPHTTSLRIASGQLYVQLTKGAAQPSRRIIEQRYALASQATSGMSGSPFSLTALPSQLPNTAQCPAQHAPTAPTHPVCHEIDIKQHALCCQDEQAHHVLWVVPGREHRVHCACELRRRQARPAVLQEREEVRVLARHGRGQQRAARGARGEEKEDKRLHKPMMGAGSGQTAQQLKEGAGLRDTAVREAQGWSYGLHSCAHVIPAATSSKNAILQTRMCSGKPAARVARPQADDPHHINPPCGARHRSWSTYVLACFAYARTHLRSSAYTRRGTGCRASASVNSRSTWGQHVAGWPTAICVHIRHSMKRANT